jgi:hypothetical protein
VLHEMLFEVVVVVVAVSAPWPPCVLSPFSFFSSFSFPSFCQPDIPVSHASQLDRLRRTKLIHIDVTHPQS